MILVISIYKIDFLFNIFEIIKLNQINSNQI